MTETPSAPPQQPENLPEVLPILPLFDAVLFPKMVLPLMVMQGDSVKLVDEAMAQRIKDSGIVRVSISLDGADRHTHEFFHGRDYPETSVLSLVFAALTAEATPRDELRSRVGLDDEVLVAALDKLWVHGGAQVDADERARARYGLKVPVLLADGEPVCSGRLDADLLADLLLR